MTHNGGALAGILRLTLHWKKKHRTTLYSARPAESISRVSSLLEMSAFQKVFSLLKCSHKEFLLSYGGHIFLYVLSFFFFLTE